MKARQLAAAPTETVVRDELLAFWDGLSVLKLPEITLLYDRGKKLATLGITSEEAELCQNKYNSLVFRGNGKGPLFSSSESRAFLGQTMKAVVKAVFERAQP
jgi:hypothetical protein